MFRSDLLQQFPLFIGDSVKESKGMALGKTVAVVYFILGLLFFDNILNKRQMMLASYQYPNIINDAPNKKKPFFLLVFFLRPTFIFINVMYSIDNNLVSFVRPFCDTLFCRKIHSKTDGCERWKK